MGRPELLVVLPVVEVEGLVSGAKLVSVGSGAGSDDMLTSHIDMVPMSIADLSMSSVSYYENKQMNYPPS